MSLNDTDKQAVQLIDLHKVKKITGMGTTFIYEQIKKQNFPKQVKVGRSSRWVKSEVLEWVENLYTSESR